MLSWACTCHKVQGLSLQNAVISFELLRQRSFNVGQMYVALSRVTNINGLFLIGEFSDKAIRVNKKACLEYERLRNENSFKPLKDLNRFPHSVTITLLNIRSLSKNAVDKNLCNSDILCLTETQLLPEINTSDIENDLKNFVIEYNNDTSNKFKSLAICYKDELMITKHVKFPGVSIFSVIKSSFSAHPFTLLLIYRQPGTAPQFFL